MNSKKYQSVRALSTGGPPLLVSLRCPRYDVPMERLFTTASAEETRAIGREYANRLSPGAFITLSGELGAGKTTFTQGLLEGLGARPPYVSPTFIIMKLYELPAPTATGIRRIYHADAYRVEGRDIEQAGIEEWASDPEGIVLFEWPERASDVLPEMRTEICLEVQGPSERAVRILEIEQ